MYSLFSLLLSVSLGQTDSETEGEGACVSNSGGTHNRNPEGVNQHMDCRAF
jgi:hypothetical protein